MLSKTKTILLLQLTLLLGILSVTTVEAQNYVFDNGRLRYGNGSENSVNTFGNLQQPFYYNSIVGQWGKLTFGTVPLDIRWGVGGDGTNNWNLNGEMITNPEVTNPAYDYSGFTITNSTAGTGYGVIVFTGNITINNQLFLLTNTYTLLENDGYIVANIKVTNVSGTTANNIRFWIGTRDDYIGFGNDVLTGGDIPLKERGNLVDGGFELISSPSEQAKSIKISTNTEATMFYSNSDRAYTTISSCCAFENATSQDPNSNTVSSTGDGSYALYAQFNDLENGESDDITIFSAGGPLSEIENIIGQVAAASSLVQNVDYSSAQFSYSFPEDGTTSIILVPQGSTNPTDAQIIAGVNYANVTVTVDSTLETLADSLYTFTFENLPYGTSYDIYALTVYTNDGDEIVTSNVVQANFQTIPNDVPVVGTGVSNQIGCLNDVFDGLEFTITDEFPGSDDFNVTLESSNLDLVPIDSIKISGTGASRILNIFPVPSNSGTSTITVSMEDEEGEIGTFNFDVTITNADHLNVIDTHVVCAGNFTWINGKVYTESNYNDKDTLTSVSGCDSIVSLHLTIAESKNTTHNVTAVGSYTWIDGITYSENVTGPSYTLVSSSGCDSIVYLNLTMNEYCTTRSKLVNFEWIKNVTIGDQINITKSRSRKRRKGVGYSLNSNDTLVVNLNDTIDVSLKPGYATRLKYKLFWRIWIDWNFDGDFNDINEKVFQGNGVGPKIGDFVVPQNVASHTLRMRISMRWKNYTNSCGTFKNGDVQDFLIRVNDADGVNGNISIGEPVED